MQGTVAGLALLHLEAEGPSPVIRHGESIARAVGGDAPARSSTSLMNFSSDA